MSNEATNVKDNTSWFRDKDIEIYKTYNLEKSFKRMQELRASQEKQLVENAVEALFKKYVPTSEISGISSFTDEVKADGSKLKEYLQNVIKIETNIHSLSKRLEALYLQRIVIDRHNESKKFSYIRRMDKPLEEAQKHYQNCLDEYSKIKSKKPEKVSIKMPKEPTPPILEKAGLFNKKKVLERNELLTAQYEEALKRYKQQIEAYEQEKVKLEQEKAQELASIVSNAHERVEEAKDALEKAKIEAENCSVVPEHVMAPLALSKSMIEKEIEDAEELLRKLILCRSELYGYNVIFSKYQNLVAVATFYEYLMAGRCELLEGANSEPQTNNSETQQEQNNEENNKIEVVELTADNWQNYLEIETVFRAETNAFNDIDNLWVSYALVLKDEYVSKFSDADGAFEFSFSEKSVHPLEYNVSTKEFTLGTAYTQEEIKSMHIGFDASETDTRIVYFGSTREYGEYGFNIGTWYSGYMDSFQAGEDVVTVDMGIWENVEITRIQGNLYFKK